MKNRLCSIRQMVEFFIEIILKINEERKQDHLELMKRIKREHLDFMK